MGKKNRKKKHSESLSNTNFPIGIYRTLESKKVQMGYGEVVIPENDFLIMQHNFPVKKKLVATIEEKFNTSIDGVDLNNKSVLVMRYGGIGDIIATLFGLTELRRIYPNIEIGYLCSPSYSSILSNFNGLVNGTANVVVSYNHVKRFKYFVYLDEVIENDPLATEIPIQDLYAKHLGVPTLKADTLDHLVAKSNLQTPSFYPRQGIGIQYVSNAPIRNYNIDTLCDLINKLADKYPNKHIHLLGRADDFIPTQYIMSKTDGRVIVNGCGNPKMDLQQTMELVSALEVVIAPDSSMLHVAGICKTPMVGLFGPFPSKLRISRYKNAIGIDGNAECSPCFRHFPLHWCKFNSGEGLCVNNIDTDLIIKNASKFLDKPVMSGNTGGPGNVVENDVSPTGVED